MRIFNTSWPRIHHSALVFALTVFSTGCSFHQPQHAVYETPTAAQSRLGHVADHDERARTRVGARAAAIALQQVGMPYRWGGHSRQGFDCSGLVYFSFAQIGITVPRTTREQRRAMRRIHIVDAQPGDLLFFKTWRRGWHVAIYLGDDDFVHAPSTGKKVTVGSLNNPYYRDHLVEVGQIVSR